MHKVGLVLVFSLLALGACDRNVEPFVPGEQPSRPELSKIFPPGAERSKDASPPMMGGGPPPAPPGRAANPDDDATGAPIRGRVAMAPALADRQASGATLFVIARGGTGGPPLAVKRIVSPSFPVEFEIGPADRMIQTLPFVGPLMLTARLDGDGNATSRSPGDLQGTFAESVEPGRDGIEIVLDQAL